jgi:addiction module RelE/StbE family toxin
VIFFALVVSFFGFSSSFFLINSYLSFLMYTIVTQSKRAQRQYEQALYALNHIHKKLVLLQHNPRRALKAHKLKGKLQGKWSCWLASNVRLVYEIDDIHEQIVVFSAGSHKIYR